MSSPKYYPSPATDITTQAIVTAWYRLPPADQQAIVEAFKPIVSLMRSHSTQGIGPQTAVELYGKIAIALVEEERW